MPTQTQKINQSTKTGPHCDAGLIIPQAYLHVCGIYNTQQRNIAEDEYLHRVLMQILKKVATFSF